MSSGLVSNVAVQFSQRLKEEPFLHRMFWNLCQKPVAHVQGVYPWALSPVPWSVCLSACQRQAVLMTVALQYRKTFIPFTICVLDISSGTDSKTIKLKLCSTKSKYR